ncbi:histidine phosphatase family protein [Eleftheria terrae]|uniref:histidine phosphatase family protein n=1 Tax=Eleftheria terrae TaxID=1597781 RepID=UPI00263AB133|nr:histidine phosphatase family protein [Eleftheria terrae]WKB53954.1 histidine phosphatase family protein [Eleftheria terrae]
MHCLIWRHPKPRGAQGRCIGRTDLPVDPRKAKRLAHRIRRAARREGWPREVWTSPLQRGAAVGRWLARWGWRHECDARLAELDFGEWDGRHWQDIGAGPVQAWCDDFAALAPGGGEALVQLFDRCLSFLREQEPAAVRLVVGHGGWMNAVALLAAGRGLPHSPGDWPAAPRYGALRRFSLTVAVSSG